MIDVKVKLLNSKAKMPEKATVGSAGFDLCVSTDTVVPTRGNGFVQVGSGVSFSMPENVVGLVFPRSSMDAKTNSILTNCVGVIDSDYTGEVSFRLKAGSVNIPGGSFIPEGTPICQVLFLRLEDVAFTEVEELPSTVRGTGGFGSTDK